MDNYRYKKKICHNCRKEIELYKDAFMFQDSAFCTEKCRYQIMKQCNFIK